MFSAFTYDSRENQDEQKTLETRFKYELVFVGVI